MHTTDPELGAKVFLLLLNFWINPVLFGRNSSETKKRLNYLQSVLCLLGMDIIDDDFIALMMNAYDKMNVCS